MNIDKNRITEHNGRLEADHRSRYAQLADQVPAIDQIVQKIIAFQVAIPSWALGTGGTRFGRFSGGGEPRTLEEKISDVGILHALNRSSGAISLLIPWEIHQDSAAITSHALEHAPVVCANNS